MLRRAGGWAGLALLGLAAGCGNGSGSHQAPGTTTSRPPVTTTTTTAPADLAYLTAWGATLAAWNQNHTPDPNHPAAYWPMLADARDTYTSMVIVDDRVVGYTLALYPSVTSASAHSRLSNDLPLDAKVTMDRTLAGCEQVVESSPTIDSVAPGGLLAELTSLSATFDPTQVATITVHPLTKGQAPAARC